MRLECEEFGIKVPKGVVGPPDIKPSLEATSEESPISPEAHSRYRRVLGRLAWLAQTRMDLLHYTSLLASGQAEPKPGHEKALRQVLRFVVTDNHVGQHFPTEDRQTHLLMGSQVIVYTDASFAPMRILQRRSISGAVLMYQAVTIKCFSRVQAAVSLSACEAELHAIQSGVQESIGLSRTLAFVQESEPQARPRICDRLGRGRVSSEHPAQNRFTFRKAAFRKLRLAAEESPHRDTSLLASPTSEQFHFGVDLLPRGHEFV